MCGWKITNAAIRLQSALEKDRRQIAMELHDRMGQSLSVLRSGFSAIARRLEKTDGDILELVKSVEEKTVPEFKDRRV